MGRTRDLVPGIVLLVSGALLARAGAAAIPGGNALLLAVPLGAVVANTTGVPSWARPGIELHKLLLETGIVLLGVTLALGEVVQSGPVILLLVLGTVAAGICLVELLARSVFRLSGKTGSLLAAGSSICGVSAVAAVAGSIDAESEEITYVAATVLLFDALTLFLFPVVGRSLGLSGQEFGIWAGLAMFSTGPVTAAGFAHSAVAGQWATLTKLVRNSLIGVVAVGYSLAYTSGGKEASARNLWSRFPKFLIGFVFVAACANLGVLSASSVASLSSLSDWLFLLAFVGLGFDIRLDRMRSTGAKPVLLVLCYVVAISVTTLVLVTAIF